MSAGHLSRMSNDAFAGLLRLLLTPLNEAPTQSNELQAYLAYLNEAARRARAERAAARVAHPEPTPV